MRPDRRRNEGAKIHGEPPRKESDGCGLASKKGTQLRAGQSRRWGGEQRQEKREEMNKLSCSSVAVHYTLHLLRALQLATSEVLAGCLEGKTPLTGAKNPATNALSKQPLRCRSNRFRSTPLQILLQPRNTPVCLLKNAYCYILLFFRSLGQRVSRG
jgi:hypothetical protein